MEQKLLTVQEVADRLALSRSKIYLLIAGGALQTVTIGRSRRITLRALEAYVSKLESEAQPGAVNAKP